MRIGKNTTLTLASLLAIATIAAGAWAQMAQPEKTATKTEATATHADEMSCCAAAEKAGLVCGMCDPDAKAELGKPAIDFMLKDTTGKTHSLSDFKGKIVVLSWFDTDCPFMVDHFKRGTFNQLTTEFKDKQVAFLTIDSNTGASAEKVTQVFKQYELKSLALMDPDGKVGQEYGAKTTPHCFVIGKDGKLNYVGAIDNAPQGKVQSGGEVVNYVSLAVNALLAGKEVATPSTKPYGCTVKYPKAAAGSDKKAS